MQVLPAGKEPSEPAARLSRQGAPHKTPSRDGAAPAAQDPPGEMGVASKEQATKRMQLSDT